MEYTLPRTHRLSGALAFARVFDGKTREQRGPVLMYAIPNGLSHQRLGLSISRKIGIAAKRVRFKRLLRESFRMLQHDPPAGYDWIVVLRPHEELPLVDYLQIMRALMAKLHLTWQKRSTGAQ